jgi:NAD(P)-dependent dehydrogenase (short-subunit alcohol dehydrogenase family)
MARICRLPRAGDCKRAPTFGAKFEEYGQHRRPGRDRWRKRPDRRKAHRDVSIDVLINSAGIAGASGQTTGNVDYDSWAHVLEVNTMGPLRVLECFIEHIARSERRLVVTITSGMGSLADNKSGGSIAYRSSKAAVNMVMRSAAIDLAPRRINCVLVNPGWVRTGREYPW